MRHRIRALIFLIMLFSHVDFAQRGALMRLIATHQYLELETALKDGSLTNDNKLFYRAFLANAINQPAISRHLTRQLIAQNLGKGNDSIRFYLCRLAYDNAVKLNDYKGAYILSEKLVHDFTVFLEATALQEQYDESEIWYALQLTPPQSIRKSGSSDIPVTRDIAGLYNIPVRTNDSSYKFIFDTGAGISTISESYAQKLNLVRVGHKQIRVVDGVNGIYNLAHIGVARHLEIGRAVISNAVFLILPDSALTFGGGAYKINGILGMPVIRALEEITIYRDRLEVPLTANKAASAHNLILDLLQSIIYLSYQGQLIPFSFDSGAQTSMFSDLFYRTFEKSLKDTSRDNIQIGGAGGYKQMAILTLPEITLENNGQQIRLVNARVSLDPMPVNKQYYFGNLGQDLISQFGSITLNFANATFSLGVKIRLRIFHYVHRSRADVLDDPDIIIHNQRVPVQGTEISE